MTIDGFFHKTPADIYNLPLRNSSLFGYSMVYMETYKSLIVSAPNADVRGHIYNIDLNMKIISQLNASSVSVANADRGVWLGATLKAVKDSLVACAPRSAKLFTTPYNEPRIEGTCFKSNLQDFTEMQHRGDNKGIYSHTNYNVIFGWSLETTENNRLLVLLVGGPGGKGHVIKYNSLDGAPDYISRQTEQKAMQNLGYSIACGRFSKKIKCAVSSTYGTLGYGKIIFYNSWFDILHVVSDDHVGTLFGAALCKVDLGSGYHQLLVGAPLSRTDISTYDVGAVSLYGKDPLDDTKMVFVKKIQGSFNGGYFGNTIISLGDLDGDGKDEVAVAAPYDYEQRGTVYIYSGAVLADVNSDNKPAQVLKPESLLYFGFSLARLGDFDDNGCNELAIGAPESNTVVVYRSFASVKIDIDVKLLNTTRKGNEVTVTFETCLEFTYPEKPKIVKGDIRYRVQAGNDIVKNVDESVTLGRALPKSCKQYSVPLVETAHQILMFEVKDIVLNEDPRSLATFDPTRVLIRNDSVLYKSGQFSISDCGGGNCHPVLSVSIKTTMRDNQYLIGSSESESFSMVVSNKGDTAYSPCIEVEVFGASILKPGSCSFRESGTRIICTPRLALRNDTNWKIENVTLETSGLTSSEEVLEVRYDVLNLCDQPNQRQNNSLKISLQRDQMFNITGNSSPDSTVNFTSGENLDGNRSVSHVYKIQNNGRTNWVGVECKVTLPKVKYATYQIFFQSDGTSRNWPIDDATWRTEGLMGSEKSEESGSVVCDIGNVFRGQSTSVYVNIKVAPHLLGLVKKTNETRTLTTSLQLLLKGDIVPDVIQRVTTTFQLKYATVALWIIILSVIVGLLLLLLIAYALYKCGFLRRQKKARLQRLRRSVYRQSMVRTRHRSRSATGDSANLVSSEEQQQKEQEQTAE
ncbi:integrin alpha-PS4-like isoform X2 [Aricia agestis]|nr:integrin alpha-PS4-like isoform X2 [Aricia agestis]